MLHIKKYTAMLYRQYYLFMCQLLSMPFVHIFFSIILLYAFMGQAFTMDYYVDSEVVINLPSTTYNWNEIGRYGLVFTKWILNTTWYNPFYTGLLLLAFLWLTACTFYYVCTKLFSNVPAVFIAIACMIFLTYPTFTEQYYFHFQSAEIAFGLFLSILCMGMFLLYTKTNALIWFIVPIPLYVLVFSIYQSFIPLALCSYLVIFVATLYSEDQAQHLSKQVKSALLGAPTQFVISFLLSQVINTLFFESEEYLSEQIIWFVDGTLFEKAKVVISTCVTIFVGDGIFYTSILALATLLAVVLWVALPLYTAHKKLLALLGMLGIVLTPFLLTLMLGSNTAIRSQFTMGFAAVALLLLAYNFGFSSIHFTQLSKRRFSTYVLELALCLLLIFQLKNVTTIYMIKDEINDYDYAYSTEILAELYDSYAVKDSVPIIFWGYVQPETNYDHIIDANSSYLFLSVYNLEHNMEPYCFYSSNRILGYYESLGHTFVYPSTGTQQLAAYIMNRDNLPVFPAEGSVSLEKTGVTVNLGNGDSYY